MQFFFHKMDFGDGSPVICQDEDEDFKMETPCSCFGSLKYAHRRCVQKWGNWVISRRDLHNPRFIAMVSTDCNFLDPDYDEYSMHPLPIIINGNVEKRMQICHNPFELKCRWMCVFWNAVDPNDIKKELNCR
ncbi:hypothetical protein IFM89_016143 [Coptis chinensis]|uniref:RING-CH-type domain-containing protein n=1 Tax=Coptis chinensis TaxID=261450 RepID=A0A835HB88_9MAGN|nr:hypothetical protein IFM89_016143 [Coptis chinensis]